MPVNPTVQRIRKVTESIISLPTLPTVVSKMIELVDNPKTSAASLARLISTDQALTAKILKLANSAYYGFPREISTVNMAIVVLGFNTVKDMGLSLSVFQVFKDSEGDKSFDVSKFWEHCIGCGAAARMMARRLKYRFVGEAFVAGLLHDIGKVILNQYVHKEFMEIIGAAAVGEMTLDEAEEKIIGTGHAQVGSWLAEKWNLPKLIVESIAFHHAPWEAKAEPELVAIVNIANYLCHCCKIGYSGRQNSLPPDERTWDIFHKAMVPLDETDIDSLTTEFLIEFDRTESIMSFIHDE
jgi:putative nucleotidyltransferase with HDIG domain